MVVDDNQPTLKADVALLFSRPPGPHQDRRTVQQSSKGHGRLETRTLSASTDLKGFVDWPGVEQGLCLERRVVCLATGEISTDTEYGVAVTRMREWVAPEKQCDWNPYLELLAMEVDFANAQVCVAGLCMQVDRLSSMGALFVLHVEGQR